jgi:hypothetical protein
MYIILAPVSLPVITSTLLVIKLAFALSFPLMLHKVTAAALYLSIPEKV